MQLKPFKRKIGVLKFDDFSTPINVPYMSQLYRYQNEQFSSNNDYLNIVFIDVQQGIFFLLMLLTKRKK